MIQYLAKLAKKYPKVYIIAISKEDPDKVKELKSVAKK